MAHYINNIEDLVNSNQFILLPPSTETTTNIIYSLLFNIKIYCISVPAEKQKHCEGYGIRDLWQGWFSFTWL